MAAVKSVVLLGVVLVSVLLIVQDAAYARELTEANGGPGVKDEKIQSGVYTRNKGGYGRGYGYDYPSYSSGYVGSGGYDGGYGGGDGYGGGYAGYGGGGGGYLGGRFGGGGEGYLGGGFGGGGGGYLSGGYEGGYNGGGGWN